MMKKTILSLLIVIAVTSLAWWFIRRQEALSDVHNQKINLLESQIEKYIVEYDSILDKYDSLERLVKASLIREDSLIILSKNKFRDNENKNNDIAFLSADQSLILFAAWTDSIAKLGYIRPGSNQ